MLRVFFSFKNGKVPKGDASPDMFDTPTNHRVIRNNSVSKRAQSTSAKATGAVEHLHSSSLAEFSTVFQDKENSIIQAQLDDVFGASLDSSVADTSSIKPAKRRADEYLPTPKYKNPDSDVQPPRPKKFKAAPWQHFKPLFVHFFIYILKFSTYSILFFRSPQELSYYIFKLSSDVEQITKDVNGLRYRLNMNNIYDRVLHILNCF